MSTAISRFRAFMPFWSEPHTHREEIIHYLFVGPVFIIFEEFVRDFLFFDWAIPAPSFDDVVSALSKPSPRWPYEGDADIDKTAWTPEMHWALFMMRVQQHAEVVDFYPGPKERDDREWTRQIYETLLYERHLWLVRNLLREDYGQWLLSFYCY